MFWKKNPLVGGKKRIYMDYVATTSVDTEVLKAMMPYFSDYFGNANSIHQEGVKAEEALHNARKSVANILNTRSEEIIFTSGGTESNNLAIFGVINATVKNGADIKDLHAVTSAIEHPSILEVFRDLEERGLNVSYIGVDESGVVNPKDVRDVIKENTVLVSIMYVNNEIGTIQPITEIAKVIRQFRKQKLDVDVDVGRPHKAEGIPYFHTDASQAPLYLPLNTIKLGIDMMTLGGQKIYGPKGIGCLYKKKNIEISSIIKGGNQEKSLRAGTENIPSIVGFAKALELADKNRENESKRLIKLRDYFMHEINEKIPQAKLNGSMELRLPNNVNIYIPNIDGEFFTVLLDSKGIACSTKSACKMIDVIPKLANTGLEDEGSYVIEALGYDKARAKSSLRFSIGKDTTKNDIDYVVEVLNNSVKKFLVF